MSFFVKWQERQTESGIQIAGPSTIDRTGEVLATQACPMQNGSQIGFMLVFVVRRLPDNKILVVDGNTCEWTQDPSLDELLNNPGPDDSDLEII